MDKLLFKRVLLGVLTALIVVYVIYLFVSANFDVIQTENAISMTVTDTIYTDGYIVRNEEYIFNNANGCIAYELDDGDEVEAGGVVANIYASESDAVARHQIEIIDEEIKELEALTQVFFSDNVNLDVIDNELDNNILDYLNNINKSNYTSADDNLHDILSSINKRQLITGKVTDFSGKISQLQTEKQQYESTSGKSIGAITSDKAGYFVSYLDGYETSFNYSNIKNVTVDDYDNIQQGSVPESAIGKIVSDLNWYVICKVSSNDALSLSFFENAGVSIEMPFSSTEKIPATIVSVNQVDKESNAVVVLKCNYMNEELADSRIESVEIGLEDFTGLRVSKKALHDDFVTKYSEDADGNEIKEKKEVQGVYVVHGNELQFKEVSIVYSGSDYVICDPEPEDGTLFSNKTVQLYDKVVIEGDNLYDGKIVS